MRMIESVQAHDVTSMHCGGTIERIYEPASTHELLDIIRGLGDFHILGCGTNIIFEDMRISKPVIRLGREFAQIESIPSGLFAGAAVPMKHLVSYCVKKGLSGLEFMAGIPGFLGGALFMNAGTPDKGILDTVMELEVVDSAGERIMRTDELTYCYRSSGIPEKTVITSAKLLLNQSTKEAVREAVIPYIIKKRTQPRGFSSGSIFKNPKEMPAGMLIEKSGLKGHRIGGAQVSDIHANFIINDGTAKTKDIKDLIRLIKEEVRVQFGIMLNEEVKIIGQ
jgi:UDP-N-acetylenolpyruvoylglucosamine reductase